ncbi:hypothetical protein CR513_42079, partial [Mucuna pruriens]
MIVIFPVGVAVDGKWWTAKIVADKVFLLIMCYLTDQCLLSNLESFCTHLLFHSAKGAYLYQFQNRNLILHILFGIWPEKLFDRSRRILKFKRLSPTHAGIVPERLFSPRSKHINWSVFFKMVGNIPESELLRIWKDCSSAKEAMDGGKFPTKWLLCKFTSIRNGQIIQQSGISPDKLFDARLRNSKFIGLSCFLHRKSSMDSENELLERSNHSTSIER